ncbi:hypothetical protein B0H16DRAFT_1455136 [Mycena metata]|uniref:Uncharacterized protein n=1 Tax=Mycena metata TaxID=1033252 RepID=A0AAD7JFM0_9AGAR|nr:hypothetical protein B0H16DRAFT_1455136 [Mycena metata]
MAFATHRRNWTSESDGAVRQCRKTSLGDSIEARMKAFEVARGEKSKFLVRTKSKDIRLTVVTTAISVASEGPVGVESSESLQTTIGHCDLLVGSSRVGIPTVPDTVTAVKITGLYGRRPARNRNRKEFSRGSYVYGHYDPSCREWLTLRPDGSPDFWDCNGDLMRTGISEVEVPVINEHQSDSTWWPVQTYLFASNYVGIDKEFHYSVNTTSLYARRT